MNRPKGYILRTILKHLASVSKKLGTDFFGISVRISHGLGKGSV